MKELFKLWITTFILLGIIFIPFSFHLFTFHTDLIQFTIGKWVVEFSRFLGFKPILRDLSSDSIGLFVLFSLLIALSLIIAVYLRKTISESRWNKYFRFVNTVAAYYLSLTLLKYGFDKVFKTQFNLPEPNLLYTPLGLLDKDILYWSTMGVSKTYNTFLGIMEILPAVLLLHERTRTIGAFIASGVMVNVVAVNFSFDISVKLFSLFLFVLALFLSWKGIKQIFNLIVLKREVKPEIPSSNYIKFKYYKLKKFLVVLLLYLEAIFPYFQSGNFNDDCAPRPYLNGAYEVIQQVNSDKNILIKRVFIHRDGYLIFQDEHDQMTDFKMEIDPLQKEMMATNYDGSTKVFLFSYHNNTLTLRLSPDTNSMIICKKLDHRSLPLLQRQFHWTVD